MFLFKSYDMKKRISFLFLCCLAFCAAGLAQAKFNGLESNMGNIYRLSDAKTRSISPENFDGAKGKGGMATTGTGKDAARDLGQGWKLSPSVIIKSKTTFTIAEIDGSGSIQHIWMTPTGNWRNSILRFYWDGEATPSVEAPVGDFFCMGWGQYSPLQSLAVCVNPGSAFNCYWPMPFRKKFRITMENIDEKDMVLYYQVNYTLTEVPADAAYFHAQFRRVNPLPYKGVYTLVDGIQGKGQYVGTYLAMGVHNNGWWGEGEIKFYMDGDTDYPTICGTGTEDYFGGAWGFGANFSAPFLGYPLGDSKWEPGTRHGLYRFHVMDPIRFEKNIRLTMQALGWRSYGRFLPLQDDISSVAYWYQTHPAKAFPRLPSRDDLEII